LGTPSRTATEDVITDDSFCAFCNNVAGTVGPVGCTTDGAVPIFAATAAGFGSVLRLETGPVACSGRAGFAGATEAVIGDDSLLGTFCKDKSDDAADLDGCAVLSCGSVGGGTQRSTEPGMTRLSELGGSGDAGGRIDLGAAVAVELCATVVVAAAGFAADEAFDATAGGFKEAAGKDWLFALLFCAEVVVVVILFIATGTFAAGVGATLVGN